MQPLGSTGEVKFLCNCEKVSKMAELHSLDLDWSQDANKLNGKAEKGREVKPTS